MSTKRSRLKSACTAEVNFTCNNRASGSCREVYTYSLVKDVLVATPEEPLSTHFIFQARQSTL